MMRRIALLLAVATGVFACAPAHAGAPSVSLVAPKGSVGFIAPASPLLYATAAADQSVPGVTIVRVDFLDGSDVIGTLPSPNASPTGFASSGGCH